jgi:hypothetical protein
MKKTRPIRKPTPRIDGNGWSLWVGDELGPTWEFVGNEYKILKMVYEEFGPEKVEQYAVSSIEFGRRYGMLYDHVVEFFNKWGISAKAVGLGELNPETPPT